MDALERHLPMPVKRIPDLTKLPAYPRKPRVFVLTDITNEPDDQESLVRYLLYSNEFETRGLCATTSAWLGTSTAPHVIQEVVDAYRKVVGNLNQHVHPDARYPSADILSGLITSGAPVYGKQALSLPPSEGAKLLVNRLTESTEPLWVLVWGGTNVLAEAMQLISRTRSRDEAKTLRSRLRVYAISDQDDTGEWVRISFPDVFFIVSIHGFGAFDCSTWLGIGQDRIPGADFTKVSLEWLKEHICIGPLGSVYPIPAHMMEGDTPTFLYLIQNGLGFAERPDVGSWGGRYRAVNVGSAHYSNVADMTVGTDGKSYIDHKATIYRWRDHFQNDFVTRMRWTLTPNFWSCTHPPVPAVNGHTGFDFLHLTAKPGDVIALDASNSHDPDHPEDNSSLEFQWYQYPEPTLRHPIGPEAVPRCILRPSAVLDDLKNILPHNDAGFKDVVLSPKVEVTVPSGESVKQWLDYTGVTTLEYHVILQVARKTAEFPVRRYKRVVIDAGLP